MHKSPKIWRIGGVKMRRNHEVKVWLTLEEKAVVKDLAFKHGLAVGAYVRFALKEHNNFDNMLKAAKNKISEPSKVVEVKKPRMVEETKIKKVQEETDPRLKANIPEWIKEILEMKKKLEQQKTRIL